MLNLCSRISIGKFEFDYVHSFESESTWENLTDNAKIIIPRNLRFEGKPIFNGSNSLFNIGDPVKVELGYDGYYDTVFQGYLTAVRPKLPMELECQDLMFAFKHQSMTKSFEKVSLDELLKFVVSESKKSKYWPKGGVEIVSNMKVDLGKFIIKTATGAQVLEGLRKTYGIQVFVRDNKLYVGLAYSNDYKKEEVFQFGNNIIEDTLDYQKAEDIKIKVEAISIDGNNKKHSVQVGDPDGATRTLHFYNVPESSLKKLAEEELPKFKKSGFQGEFETFGQPFVQHGDAAILRDPKLTERNGTYLIKKVSRSFSVDGYRQGITLDKKIA